jgi:hypothetical protein
LATTRPAASRRSRASRAACTPGRRRSRPERPTSSTIYEGSSSAATSPRDRAGRDVVLSLDAGSRRSSCTAPVRPLRSSV